MGRRNSSSYLKCFCEGMSWWNASIVKLTMGVMVRSTIFVEHNPCAMHKRDSRGIQKDGLKRSVDDGSVCHVSTRRVMKQRIL